MQTASSFYVYFGIAVVLSGCQTSYKAVNGPMPSLKVEFADTQWTGQTVPKIGVCKSNGGKGFSPTLVVSNIPVGANAILVKFSDRSYARGDNGGHGTIGYPIKIGTTKATLKSVPGLVINGLPHGAWVEQKNVGGGGYIGPCSGGRGNLYEAELLAVFKPAKEKQEGRLLAEGDIRLGRF